MLLPNPQSRWPRHWLLLLLLFPFSILGCADFNREPDYVVLNRIGNVNLNFKDVTLDSLSKTLKRKGREKEKPEINTSVVTWFGESIEAKFVDVGYYYDSLDAKAKLISLKIKSDYFHGSILGVHINESMAKVPELLSKFHCDKITQDSLYGTADLDEQWHLIWFYNHGLVENIEVENWKYVRWPVPKTP